MDAIQLRSSVENAAITTSTLDEIQRHNDRMNIIFGNINQQMAL